MSSRLVAYAGSPVATSTTRTAYCRTGRCTTAACCKCDQLAMSVSYHLIVGQRRHTVPALGKASKGKESSAPIFDVQ